MPLTEADIQPWLDKRRPGQSRFTTQRQEPDTVKILSGVFEGLTTGTPISLMIENVDQRSKDYGEIKDKFRPGHADYTYWAKYGIRDYRGGGRSSARETAMPRRRRRRRAQGAGPCAGPVTIRGALVQIGPHAHRPRPLGLGRRSSRTRSSAPMPAGAGVGELSRRRRARPAPRVGAVIEVVAERRAGRPGRADLRQARRRPRRAR